MAIEENIPLLEEILGGWKAALGEDYLGYRNHVYRMVHFCLALRVCGAEEKQKILVAAAFHDLGIWSDHTVDYLPPSIALAKAYLLEHDLASWSEEIALMIDEHHKLRPSRNPRYPLVEVFRRGDLVDFSLGTVKWGLPGAYVARVKATFPNAGFHKRLLQLAGSWFAEHPLSPPPFVKW
ncbi:MAG: hypothetical protein M0P39_02625 [Rhodocyclaceae bacterium]|jgi:hypothetical protein|nr:hypothetical protein [Rhodocyclaceae bacterium]